MKDTLIINEGITSDQVRQLLDHIRNDEAVKTYTRDVARFINYEKTLEWFKNVFKVFTLTDDTGDLLGLIWFQKVPVPDGEFFVEFDHSLYNHTNAVRLYGRARGKGLASWFMEAAYDRIGKPPVWAEISHHNRASIRTHEKLDYRKVSNPNEKNKIIMILP